MKRQNPIIKSLVASALISLLLTLTIITASTSEGINLSSMAGFIQILNVFGCSMAFICCVSLLGLESCPKTLIIPVLVCLGSGVIVNDISLFSVTDFLFQSTHKRGLQQLAAYSLVNAAFVYAIVFFMCNFCHIIGRLAHISSFVATLPLALIMITAIISKNFMSIDTFHLSMFMYREVIILLFPAIFGFVVFNSEELRVPYKTFREAITFRLSLVGDSYGGKAIFWGISASSLVALVSYGIMLAPGESHTTFLTFIWAPLTYFAYVNLKTNYFLVNDLIKDTSIADYAAKTYLKRHYKNQAYWASTTGIQTASFIINHTPHQNDSLHEAPTTVQQIRSQLIRDSVDKILKRTYMNYTTMSSKIYGSINPEHSHRPCIESIILFTCLYMDAIPLLERRLKTIGQILPILDRGFEEILFNSTTDLTFSRNAWLYYLDYTWVDQYVIHQRGSVNYQFEGTQLSSEYKSLVVKELHKRGLMGNNIWISDACRKRLAKESPYLSQITVPVELPLPEQYDRIIFLIKFEDLIPRLQRFYMLDSRRKELRDLPLTQDARRLCNLIELQISQDLDLGRAEEILRSIVSFPWSGFRAKDSALELIMQLYNKTVIAIKKSIIDGTQVEEMIENTRAHFMRAVMSIGYPSQVLHNAQMQKLAMRDLATSIAIAADMEHPKFYDAWLYFSNRSYSTKEKDFEHILNFLYKSTLQDWKENTTFVFGKIISTINMFEKDIFDTFKEKIDVLVNTVFVKILEKDDFDQTVWMMDVFIQTQQTTDHDVTLQPSTKTMLQDFSKKLENVGDDSLKLAFAARIQKINKESSFPDHSLNQSA